MKAPLLLVCGLFLSASLFGQIADQDRARYEILEVVLLRSDARSIYHVPINDVLRQATSDLQTIQAADTAIRFDEKATSRFLAQLESSTIKTWDQKKVYRYKVIDTDPFASLNVNPDSASRDFGDRTIRVHRVSLPVFVDSNTAFVLIATAAKTFVDGKAIVNKNSQEIFFLSQQKKRWKVIRSLILSEN